MKRQNATREPFCRQHSYRVQVAGLVSYVLALGEVLGRRPQGQTLKEASMKMSIRFAPLAFCAASVIALVGSPASAQTLGGRNCSNFKNMDKTKQCVHVLEQQRISSFVKANPPQTQKDYIANGGSHVVMIQRGVDGNGRPYQIVYGNGGQIRGSGSASFLNTRPGGGGSGGKRSTN